MDMRSSYTNTPNAKVILAVQSAFELLKENCNHESYHNVLGINTYS